KKYRTLSKEHKQVKDKYNDLVQKHNSTVDDYNELVRENKSLKSKISDLRHEIGSIYKSTKEFLKERTDGLKAFQSIINELITKGKEKKYKGKLESLTKQEKSKEKDKGREVNKAPEKGAFLMVLRRATILLFLFFIHIGTIHF